MRKLFILAVLLLSACSSIQSGGVRTPIPTLIPATLPAPKMIPVSISYGIGACKISVLDLIGAWVVAGKPENNPFPFSSINNESCTGTFPADILPLFDQPNIWFSGSIACVTCHGEDVTKSPAGLSLVDYQNILAGSRRTDQSSSGNTILGDEGKWEKSKLYIQIFTRQMPVGRPVNSPEKGPILNAGSLLKTSN